MHEQHRYLHGPAIIRPYLSCFHVSSRGWERDSEAGPAPYTSHDLKQRSGRLLLLTERAGLHAGIAGSLAVWVVVQLGFGFIGDAVGVAPAFQLTIILQVGSGSTTTTSLSSRQPVPSLS